MATGRAVIPPPAAAPYIEGEPDVPTRRTDMTLETTRDPIPSPNEDVMAFWRDVMVEKYRRFRATLVGATAVHTARALALHPPPLHAHVLDVGCGFGETTIAWARHVGPEGRAVGVDPCEPFLTVGRADAAAAGVQNTRFVRADAQTTPFADFDRIFSAFGVMFFAQPVAALRNLRAALRPSGRMQLLVWNERAANPWLTLALEACERVLPPVPKTAATCGPGPFSMADPDTLRAMLGSAGLDDVELHLFDVEVPVGADAREAIDFQLALGPAGERMRVAGASGTEVEAQIREEVRRLLRPHERADGIWLRSSVWYATGVRGPRGT